LLITRINRKKTEDSRQTKSSKEGLDDMNARKTVFSGSTLGKKPSWCRSADKAGTQTRDIKIPVL